MYFYKLVAFQILYDPATRARDPARLQGLKNAAGLEASRLVIPMFDSRYVRGATSSRVITAKHQRTPLPKDAQSWHTQTAQHQDLKVLARTSKPVFRERSSRLTIVHVYARCRPSLAETSLGIIFAGYSMIILRLKSGSGLFLHSAKAQGETVMGEIVDQWKAC